MVSSILPKNEQKIRFYYYAASSRIVFVPFLGELKRPKRHLEINWPLHKPPILVGMKDSRSSPLDQTKIKKQAGFHFCQGWPDKNSFRLPRGFSTTPGVSTTWSSIGYRLTPPRRISTDWPTWVIIKEDQISILVNLPICFFMRNLIHHYLHIWICVPTLNRLNLFKLVTILKI